MLAAVLVLAGGWDSERPLLTYLVPSDLEKKILPGQLVAAPYGERLVEGVVWRLLRDDEFVDTDATLRPLRSLLDPEPALLPHQRALAEEIAHYYVTPLSQVAMMMVPRGLIQRSQFVVRLAQGEQADSDEVPSEVSLRTRALIGLLLADGERDIEQFKKMLGPKRAKELLKEALASGVIERDSLLAAPKVRPRIQRIVRLVAERDVVWEWRQRTQAILQKSREEAERRARRATSVSPLPPVRTPAKKSRRGEALNLWKLPKSATATLPPVSLDREGLVAQRRLMAVDLLLYGTHEESTLATGTAWTPHKLCQASKLTPAQLQQLVREHIVEIEEREIRRNPLEGRSIVPSNALELTADQRRALEQILHAASLPQDADIAPIVLHGVTGSGKTEVYLQALAAMLAQGKRGIVLVPEIALTTQAVQRIAARFPGRVAIMHSALGLGERYDEWRRIRSGEVDIVIGARAALFVPLPDLGLIILDEEHEPAYKQSGMRPTYHAREAAVMLGRILHIPVVLGSATPSIETFYRAKHGNYQLVELPGRIGATLPPVEIVDLRAELHAGNTSIISRRLYAELERVLSQGQQAILFLNRRGAASCVLCRDCGFVAICERCDLPLTYHSTERILLCHYCGQRSKLLKSCPVCHSGSIRYFGLGTEKVQETIQRDFPNARLLRWDRDTARSRQAHEQLLDRFANREADILIGTQMIAKGLDLPGVTLVGVISADVALNLPDYSSTERAFTLLTQVAGRAGRGEQAGRVILQTFNPQHLCIDTASRHNYHEFYAAEIALRQRYGYPPFRHFVKFTYSHENRHRCQNAALQLCERLQEWIELLKLEDTDIVGPAPAFMERIRGKYRWQMIARGPDLHTLLRVIDAPGWEIDIDPVSTL